MRVARREGKHIGSIAPIKQTNPPTAWGHKAVQKKNQRPQRKGPGVENAFNAQGPGFIWMAWVFKSPAPPPPRKRLIGITRMLPRLQEGINAGQGNGPFANGCQGQPPFTHGRDGISFPAATTARTISSAHVCKPARRAWRSVAIDSLLSHKLPLPSCASAATPPGNSRDGTQPRQRQATGAQDTHGLPSVRKAPQNKQGKTEKIPERGAKAVGAPAIGSRGMFSIRAPVSPQSQRGLDIGPSQRPREL